MKKLIAANWKMNCTLAEGAALVDGLSSANNPKADVLICPPYTLIARLADKIKAGRFMLGAQDCHYEEKGAFTGDISAGMLKDLGCSHVIVGHSERRLHHHESSGLVARKAHAALNKGLKPIICVGETLTEREANRHMPIVAEQLEKSLPENGAAESIIIAYEPVWAIGTGVVASLDEIRSMHEFLKEKLKQVFPNDSFCVIYGGSVSEGNAKEILSLTVVDGALVGGASLKADSFLKIIGSIE